MMGGNGGHDGKGGAVVDGPFTLQQGWTVNTALHRPSWFIPLEVHHENVGEDVSSTVQQPSLGRSIVRYMGDCADLANRADILEYAKRKAVFGPDKLIVRSDTVQPVPDSHPEGRSGAYEKAAILPRGTLHIGDTLPLGVIPSTRRPEVGRSLSLDSFDICDEDLGKPEGETPQPSEPPLRIRKSNFIRA